MQFDMAGVSVMLVMPTHRDIPAETCVSLLATADEMRSRNIPFEVQLQVGGSIIESARSKMAALFLKSNKSRLFWVDSDMVWDAGAFNRVLALSTVHYVVGASYPAKCEPLKFMLSTESEVETDELGTIPVRGAGLGFTCVHRSVIEALADRAPVLRFPDLDGPIPHIFRCDSLNGEFRGEDMAFFADCRAAGFDVRLDPSVRLGHVGSKTYRGALLDVMQESAPQGA